MAIAHQTRAFTGKQESMQRWQSMIYQNRLGLCGIQHAAKFALALRIVAICGQSDYSHRHLMVLLSISWHGALQPLAARRPLNCAESILGV